MEDHPHKKVVCYHHIISLPQIIMISGTKKCTHVQNSGLDTKRFLQPLPHQNYCVNANKITCFGKKPCCVKCMQLFKNTKPKESNDLWIGLIGIICVFHFTSFGALDRAESLEAIIFQRDKIIICFICECVKFKRSKIAL